MAQDIGIAWLMTIPIAALLSAGIYRLINPLFH
jgi:phosphate/sulfate permease